MINLPEVAVTICVFMYIGVNGKLNFTELGHKYGHNVEEHKVITEDGYILKMFNIPGDTMRPILLVHGIIDSADTFIIRGNTSLAIALANKGYDVWILNIRGNRYSRAHVNLNPDLIKFWDFSFHEMGYYDLPAAIDYILGKTNQQQLSAIGHSQGNTLFYVLGSMRSEYNTKVKIMIALAPICFLHHVKPPVYTLISSLPILDGILRSIGVEEVFSDISLLNKLYRILCSEKDVGYELCVRGIFFSVGGSDPEELEPEFLPEIVAHYPTSTSGKNGAHVGQVALRRNFSQFDYGPLKNVVVYNSVIPPSYDLRKVTMNIALFVGRNDGISSVKDAEMLRDRLPNVDYLLLDHKRLNHLDYVWGRNMDKYLFPDIFSVLNNYV